MATDNFTVLKNKTKFQDEGINKRAISLDDQKQLILEDKEIEEINLKVAIWKKGLRIMPRTPSS